MRIAIHYKITLIFGLILAVILAGIYFYLNRNLKKHTYQRIRTSLKRELNLSKSYLEDQNTQSNGFDAIADKIGAELDARVTIISIDGIVRGDSELDEHELAKIENHLYRPEIQQALKEGFGESTRFSTTIKMDMLYMAALYGRDSAEGFIRLSIPLAEIEIISSKLKKMAGMLFIPAFLCAILISFAASMFISKPIREISFIAQCIARGDYTKRIAIIKNNEIGDLAKVLNGMSEQIKARIEEVTAGKSRLEAVLLSMFEGVMVTDIKGSILLMNQTLKEFLRVTQEPDGKKPIEVIRNIEIQEITDRVLQLHKEVESREISVFLEAEKILLVHAVPIRRADMTEGAVLVFHDITELRRLENIRKDFVANVSHELKTPVTSIKGYAETLLDGALTDKKNAKDFIQIIFSDSERLARLIDDLLDLSKIESGKLIMNLKPYRIKPIIEKVVSLLQNQADSKSIAVKVDIQENPSDILVDEARFAQVLLNLIDNAVKYTNENGRITITAQEQDTHLRIDICDTGIGIPEKDIPRLFERFYRVDKARSRELGGTGLGLSIVKHIVEAHGGEISVQSIVGTGSTFTITIPKA